MAAELFALVSDPLALAAGWPVLLAAAVIARLTGSTLFLVGLAALATLSLAETSGLGPQIFPPAVAAFGPYIGLLALGSGAIIAVLGTFVGDNLMAAAVGAAFVACAKGAWALVTAPFVFATYILRGRARSREGRQHQKERR